jgi:lipopolysaccharide transport system permease protein
LFSCIEMKEIDDWDIDIASKSNLFDLKLKEVWQYRDLILMFIKRDFIALYKQTILGSLWFIIQPLMTTLTYMVVFGTIAHLPTDEQPEILFYLSGIVFWNFFSSSLLKTADTFSANAGIFGKVYFPRLTVPIANVCTTFISFIIQFTLFIVIYVAYIFIAEYRPDVSMAILLVPFLLIITGALSLGLGIIISSLTTKYRDLKFVVMFGIQLLMYAAPIVYPASMVTDHRLYILIQLNPITPIIETFRHSMFGSGNLNWFFLGYAALFTITILICGIALFNKVEKNFMDTI